MKTDTLITTTLTESIRFDSHRSMLAKADRLLDLAGRAYRMYAIKVRDLEEEDIHFIVNPEKTLQQAKVYLGQYNRLWKYYKRMISNISHN